jgi:hypothetical protein
MINIFFSVFGLIVYSLILILHYFVFYENSTCPLFLVCLMWFDWAIFLSLVIRDIYTLGYYSCKKDMQKECTNGGIQKN